MYQGVPWQRGILISLFEYTVSQVVLPPVVYPVVYALCVIGEKRVGETIPQS